MASVGTRRLAHQIMAQLDSDPAIAREILLYCLELIEFEARKDSVERKDDPKIVNIKRPA